MFIYFCIYLIYTHQQKMRTGVAFIIFLTTNGFFTLRMTFSKFELQLLQGFNSCCKYCCVSSDIDRIEFLRDISLSHFT